MDAIAGTEGDGLVVFVSTVAANVACLARVGAVHRAREGVERLYNTWVYAGVCCAVSGSTFTTMWANCAPLVGQLTRGGRC